ncbi:uncharacterized protein LOC142351731 [Convolutriloba macropyga]|uniref:uncharacterized protein LOC142351731 n=1 Tax=Convolutriloba macropyga TaxID=536237 RepID=UPI003F52197F
MEREMKKGVLDIKNSSKFVVIMLLQEKSAVLGRQVDTSQGSVVDTDPINCSAIPPTLTSWVREPCPCYCGTGTTTEYRYCVWYEQDDNADGGCVEKRTRDDTNDNLCDNASLTVITQCTNGSCLINLVSDQTADVSSADSDSVFLYEAFTSGGQICNIGKLDHTDKKDRRLGTIDSYPLSMPCDACMRSSTETFEKLRVTIQGTDAWQASWIMVEVNNNKRTYYNTQFLDENGSLFYDPYYK